MKKLKVQTRTSSKLDGIPNIRFFLLGEVYALGIAAALDVGHAIVTPAVLVVADQKPVVIRRQRRLPGTCCEEGIQSSKISRYTYTATYSEDIR